jgi:hypothetical protein
MISLELVVRFAARVRVVQYNPAPAGEHPTATETKRNA